MYFCLKSDMCINRKKVYITFKTYFEIWNMTFFGYEVGMEFFPTIEAPSLIPLFIATTVDDKIKISPISKMV